MCASSVNTDRYKSQSLVSTARAYLVSSALISSSSLIRWKAIRDAPIQIRRHVHHAPSDRVDPLAGQVLQRMDGHNHRHPAVVVEHGRGDGRHRLRTTRGIVAGVVGEETDGGEFGQQLIGDLAYVSGQAVAG